MFYIETIPVSQEDINTDTAKGASPNGIDLFKI